MATATLDAPQAMDPTVYASFRLVSAFLIFSNNAMQVDYELLDAQGNVVGRKRIDIATAASQTYVGNQETLILQRLVARLGLPATIA